MDGCELLNLGCEATSYPRQLCLLKLGIRKTGLQFVLLQSSTCPLLSLFFPLAMLHMQLMSLP